MSDDVTMNVRGLEQIIKSLKVRPPIARVGILGADASKKHKNGSTNAEVGAAHEFGSSKLPQRSFLRMPISDRLNKEMAASNLFDKDKLAEVIKTGSVIPWIKTVAHLAEKIVQDAFNSDGFGKWAAWKGSYTSSTGNILVDTTQLRNSITSEVRE